ncbi:MAG: IS630 family transposase [Bacteroidota bacterium]
MCKNPLLTKRFLKNLSGKFESLQVKFEQSGCSRINLYFEDESRFGLLTVLRRMITAKGIKPVAPFLHRFDNLYLFGAFSPITGASCLLEMPHCNSHTFQLFLDHLSRQTPAEFKILILDNGAFHHATRLQIPDNMELIFLPPYSPELNPAEKMWRYFKDRVSMIAYNSLELLQHKLSEITNLLSPDLIKSICGNQFYKNTFRSKFNV